MLWSPSTCTQCLVDFSFFNLSPPKCSCSGWKYTLELKHNTLTAEQVKLQPWKGKEALLAVCRQLMENVVLTMQWGKTACLTYTTISTVPFSQCNNNTHKREWRKGILRARFFVSHNLNDNQQMKLHYQLVFGLYTWFVLNSDSVRKQRAVSTLFITAAICTTLLTSFVHSILKILDLSPASLKQRQSKVL